MRHSFITIGWLFIGLLLAASTAVADMAVLVQVTEQTVSLERVERAEESGSPTSHENTEEVTRGLSASQSVGSENDGELNEGKLLVRWYNAKGELIHQEALQDPRFVHAPGSQELQLPEATLLLRAPNSAVLLRIKPRAFTQFIDLNV